MAQKGPEPRDVVRWSPWRDGGCRCPQTAAAAPPPLGWYLPAVATREAELDSFDVVEGLVLEGGPQVEVLTGITVHGGLVAVLNHA
jgi:hypothetical protein